MTDYHHGVRVIEVTSGTRPLRTVQTAVIGVVGTAPDADTTAFPLNTPVLIAADRTQAAKLGIEGTLPRVMDAIFNQVGALIVVIRVDTDPDEARQISNVIGTTTDTGHFTGLQGLLAAANSLGIKPRILGAPGFSHHAAVASALASIAEKLRAFAYADLDVSTVAEALTARKAFGQRRLMLLWPAVKVWDARTAQTIVQPASARALGLRAKIDHDTGWHKVLSNVTITGVTGLSADIDFDLQNPNTQAGLLNQNEITTLIMQDGYRFWGSRTCSSDALFAFESAVRTADILRDTIADGHAWAIDKPMSRVLFDDIIDGVNAKFRQLKSQRYVVDARCYLDPDQNDTTTLKAGQLYLNYDFTPVPPLEQLTFQAGITDQYLVQLVAPDAT